MKPSFKFLPMVALASGLLTPSAVCQSFAVRPVAITGGGGASSGGAFSVTGSIGQLATIASGSGNFVVSGGVWGALVPVQQPDAPTLSIVANGPGSAIISWTPATAGFVLQYTDGFGSDTWHDAASNSENPVPVQTPPAVRFYRLIKP
ncbi:MAG TPA: hypothetical protein VLD18_05030 [Verrucomicrobiae bacterium]|nr:hypothetical protein [Verrucomicrobiae bacterium]